MATLGALEMTDEEFAQLPDSYFDEAPATGEADDEEQEPLADDAKLSDADDDAGDDSTDADVSALEEEDADDEDEPADSTDDSGDADDNADGDDGDSDSGDDDSDDASADTDTEVKADAEVDYKAAYESLMAGFKANGKDMKVDNVDDARRLMQMGANYNKKMQGLKPNLKILKTLEKAEIDEEKLNFLIDLDKKDPAAIARLVKEAGLEPGEIDTDEAENYKAANHSPKDNELALDEVIEGIKDSPHYNQTLDLVASKWDAASKQAVVDSPQLLTLINDHMASGIYDVITPELEKQKMLGQLNGMSDLEAYRTVGDAIQARKGFDHLFQPEQGQQDPAPVKPTPRKTAEDAKRKDKKRAASPNRAAPPSAAADYNPLAMTDEDFEKQFPG